MLHRLGRIPAVCWSAECELRACLERLRARRRDLSARLDAGRRLLAHLRDGGAAVPAARLADWAARLEGLDGDADDAALHAEVGAPPPPPAAPPALGLLALWLQPAGESRFSERALKDLTLLWSLTHDPWYAWPAGVPPEVAGLIAAAREGDWPRLADGAARLLRGGADLSRRQPLGRRGVPRRLAAPGAPPRPAQPDAADDTVIAPLARYSVARGRSGKC